MSTQVARARRLIAVGARGVVRTAPEISGPVPCPSCLGEGALRYRSCRHSSPCPCAEYERPCEDCRGSGHLQCAYCGGAAAEVETRWGRYCRECAAEVANG